MSRAGTPINNAAMEAVNDWIKAELFTGFHVTSDRDVALEVYSLPLPDDQQALFARVAQVYRFTMGLGIVALGFPNLSTQVWGCPYREGQQAVQRRRQIPDESHTVILLSHKKAASKRPERGILRQPLFF